MGTRPSGATSSTEASVPSGKKAARSHKTGGVVVRAPSGELWNDVAALNAGARHAGDADSNCSLTPMQAIPTGSSGFDHAAEAAMEADDAMEMMLAGYFSDDSIDLDDAREHLPHIGNGRVCGSAEPQGMYSDDTDGD